MFDKDKIRELYPGAENLMFEAGLIWKLPQGKEHMLSEVCESGDYFLQEKIDGALYQFVKGDNDISYLFGRTISKTTGLLTEKGGNVPHIMSALDCLWPGTILIGEIYVPGGTSKDCTHIMGCLSDEAIKRQEKEGYIHYYIHDMIYCNGTNLMNVPAELRYKLLTGLWKRYNLEQYDFLRLAVKVDENLEEEISRILAEGGEGAVLKKRDGKYVPGKRPAWETLKIKKMDSVDLICTGLCNATREYTGKEQETWPYWAKRLPIGDCDINVSSAEELSSINHYGEEEWEPVTKYYYQCYKTAINIGGYDDNGNLVDLGTVSSGLTDTDKELMSKFPNNYIGKVVSLDCMSISHDSMTLRHPVFKCFREDKNAKDCKLSDIFN